MGLRRRVSWISWTVFFMLSALLIPVRQAHAYLDPGTGSYIIQIVIAGLLGAALSVRLFWHRIVGLFTGSQEATQEAGQQSNPVETDGDSKENG